MKFFFEGDDFFRELQAAIQGAARTIDLEWYYVASDRLGWSLANLLINKASEGLRVRLLYDVVGCRSTPDELFETLKNQGVQVEAYNPVLFKRHWRHRNHRKTCVIDGRLAFLGGFNMAEEYVAQWSGEKAWRDTGVCLEIPDVVRRIELLFEESWAGHRPSLVDLLRRKAPRPDWKAQPVHVLPNHGWRRKSSIRQEYLSAIIHAQKNIWITNPYFIPDRGLRRALRRAAKRGVDVRFLTAGVSDVPMALWAGRAAYSKFFRAGIRIFEYQGRVLHAKSAVIDAEWYMVGTANWDYLSFFRNLEINLVGRESALAAPLAEQFQKDLQSSREMTWEAWKKRPWWERWREKFCFFFRVWL